MKLSIVIPTYNEEELLPRLLVSLRKQSFQDFEIVVADAASTDRTRAIASGSGCRVVDGGLPAAGRNKGAAAAEGEILLFLDADVELNDPHFIERMVHDFEYHHLDVATSFIEPLSERTIDSVFSSFYNRYIFATQTFFPHAHGFCIMARKEVHLRIGGFDETVRLAEDHEYAQRAARLQARYGVLPNISIPVSTRRFSRDGYLTTACKYVLCELHMMTLGAVKSDIFRYRFGHAKARVADRP